jgi:hypothetical protein
MSRSRRVEPQTAVIAVIWAIDSSRPGGDIGNVRYTAGQILYVCRTGIMARPQSISGLDTIFGRMRCTTVRAQDVIRGDCC